MGLPGDVGLLAEATISWGAIVGAGLAGLLTTAATWLIAARVTTAILQEQTKQLRTELATISTSLGDVERQINRSQSDRAACELRAARTHATRAELVDVMATAQRQGREVLERIDGVASSFRDSVGKLHGRVDRLAERLARAEAIDIAPSAEGA